VIVRDFRGTVSFDYVRRIPDTQGDQKQVSPYTMAQQAELLEAGADTYCGGNHVHTAAFMRHSAHLIRKRIEAYGPRGGK
jgi:hypothetical protein